MHDGSDIVLQLSMSELLRDQLVALLLKLETSYTSVPDTNTKADSKRELLGRLRAASEHGSGESVAHGTH